MKTKFYICPICGNIIVKVVDSGVTPMCCGKPMEELIAHTEDAGFEKHLPVIKERCGHCINVKVGEKAHPMEKDHHIVFIAMECEHELQIKFLDAKDDEACASFVCNGGKCDSIYVYCNVHGLWKRDVCK